VWKNDQRHIPARSAGSDTLPGAFGGVAKGRISLPQIQQILLSVLLVSEIVGLAITAMERHQAFAGTSQTFAARQRHRGAMKRLAISRRHTKLRRRIRIAEIIRISVQIIREKLSDEPAYQRHST
jgi:hypothetical protein